MELRNFIGKVVINQATQTRYILREVNAAYIGVATEQVGENGRPSGYNFDCINGDPFTNGVFIFENAGLTEQFQEAYRAHCDSAAGYWEDYGYWMRKD